MLIRRIRRSLLPTGQRQSHPRWAWNAGRARIWSEELSLLANVLLFVLFQGLLVDFNFLVILFYPFRVTLSSFLLSQDASWEFHASARTTTFPHSLAEQFDDVQESLRIVGLTLHSGDEELVRLCFTFGVRSSLTSSRQAFVSLGLAFLPSVVATVTRLAVLRFDVSSDSTRCQHALRMRKTSGSLLSQMTWWNTDGRYCLPLSGKRVVDALGRLHIRAPDTVQRALCAFDNRTTVNADRTPTAFHSSSSVLLVQTSSTRWGFYTLLVHLRGLRFVNSLRGGSCSTSCLSNSGSRLSSGLTMQCIVALGAFSEHDSLAAWTAWTGSQARRHNGQALHCW